MTSFLRMFQHLFPNAAAWRITIQKKLRQFIEGLTGIPSDIKDFADDAYEDIFPDTTREIPAWNDQFNLKDTGLTEAEERDRLDAAWKATGGQSPRYIEDTLRARGFDVRVHEWWEPGTEKLVNVQGCVTPRDPRLVLRQEFTNFFLFTVLCGEPDALCGEAEALAGNTIDPVGYPLVNLVLSTMPNILVLCGEVGVLCGEPDALCGFFEEFDIVPQNYIVPEDPVKWPYFLYIGGENFPDIATIPPSRKNEFEELCLKICPTQQWLGILVQYA